MKKDDLRLNYLSINLLWQEFYTVSFLLEQIPYQKDTHLDIWLEDIPTYTFKDKYSDWLTKLLEIFERFERIGIIKDYKGEIIDGRWFLQMNQDEKNLVEYKELLDKAIKQKTHLTKRLFCNFENKTFLFEANSGEKSAINFSSDKEMNQTFILFVVLYEFWKEKYINEELNSLYQCTVSKKHIIDEMKKRGFADFASKPFNEAKRYLEGKLNLDKLISKHVTFEFKNKDSYTFGINP